MKYVKLNTVCDINIGKTPSRSKQEYWGLGTKWISIADIKSTYITDTKEQITSLGIEQSKIKLVPKDTVIMSFKLTVGKVAITGEDMYTNEAIASFPIKDNSKLYTKYLYYCLQTLNLMSATDRAVMGATLNKAKLNEIKIPYVDYDQQIQIANILDQAQELIDKRKAQIEALDELIQSVFYEMFGDPISNLKGYNKESLINISDIITGNTPPRKNIDNYGDAIEWIKSDNINTPYHYITVAEEFLSETGMKIGRVVDAGSILMTCIAGSLSCIGNVALVDRKISFNQQINGIVPKDIILAKFLYVQLLLSKQYIQNSSTNSMKGMVSKGTLSNLEFIVPPMQEQLLFESIFNNIMDQIKLQRESLVELEKNFNSLMQRAFNGEVMF